MPHPQNTYQYIGNQFNLEGYCIDDMNMLKEEILLPDVCEKMGIKVILDDLYENKKTTDIDLMFPRLEKGSFYESVFDGIPCIIYELPLFKENKSGIIQFVWLKLD